MDGKIPTLLVCMGSSKLRIVTYSGYILIEWFIHSCCTYSVMIPCTVCDGLTIEMKIEEVCISQSSLNYILASIHGLNYFTVRSYS